MTIRITIDLATASPLQRALFADPQIQHTLKALRDLVGDPTADVQMQGAVRFGAHRSVIHAVQRVQDFKFPIDAAAAAQEPTRLPTPAEMLAPHIKTDD